MPENDRGCEAYLVAKGIDPKTVSCCMSCHDEWDEGYGEPIEEEVGDKTYYVCCAVSRSSEDKTP